MKIENESQAITSMVSKEAKRRPDLLASLVMTWLDEDGGHENRDARKPSVSADKT